MAHLRVARDGVELFRFQLRQSDTLVGRSPDCDLGLPDPTVSRIQLRLELRQGLTGTVRVILHAEGAAEVRVGGRAVQRVALRGGDRISFSSWTLAFVLDPDDGEVTPPTMASDEPVARLVALTELGARVEQPALVCDQRGRLLLQDARLRVGSDATADWCLRDGGLLPLHFELIRRGGRWFVRDLEGPVRVGGHGVLGEAELVPGQEFTAGSLCFRLELELLEEPIEIEGAARVAPLLGRSVAMQGVRARIARVACEPVPVLVTGESGTGKELAARAIHEGSSRCQRAFVPINCGGLRPGLVASELFGHVKGAFTGADGERVGAFGLADGGTLFLDEVGELPLEVQAALLRVLETGEVRPVGSARSHQRDVRIVAATHRDLMNEVAEGRFREDLLYRLWVFHIGLPPLRERGEDIIALASEFTHQYSRGTRSLCPAAKAFLLSQEWPGNVRGLRNAIIRACIQSEGKEILVKDIELMPRRFVGASRAAAVGTSLRDQERAAVVEAIRACAGNKTAAARRLEIAKSTLFQKLTTYDISEEEWS